MADDALHRLHVAETPELEALLHVHQLFAHVVFGPELRAVLVDALEHRQQRLVATVRPRPVALQQFGRHRVATPRQVTQELVIQAGRLQYRAQLRLRSRIVREYLEHVGVLVAQQEFDLAILQRLETGRRPQHAAELQVLRRRQRLQHRPLLEQLALHLLHPRQDLQAGIDVIGLQVQDRCLQLVDQQLHPQLGDVVLHDEQHLVVMRRLAQRLLCRQQGVQMQIAAVGDLSVEIGLDTGFEIALVVGHGVPSRFRKTAMVTAAARSVPDPGHGARPGHLEYLATVAGDPLCGAFDVPGSRATSPSVRPRMLRCTLQRNMPACYQARSCSVVCVPEDASRARHQPGFSLSSSPRSES